MPVYRLLGGACREKIQLYTHCFGRAPDESARNAADLVAQGWRALKTGGAWALRPLAPSAPDVCPDGGIMETRNIAAMAETYYVRVAPHNPNGPVATAASLQLGACLPNFVILECAQNQPWRDQVIVEPLEIVDGYVDLPTRPGLGIELDHSAIAKLPYEPRDYRGGSGRMAAWRTSGKLVAELWWENDMSRSVWKGMLTSIAERRLVEALDDVGLARRCDDTPLQAG